MKIDKEVVLECKFHCILDGKPSIQKFTIRALVAPVQNNLLSAMQICHRGWSIKFMNQRVVVTSDHGSQLECHVWTNCPWLRQVPSRRSSSPTAKPSKEVSFKPAPMDIDRLSHTVVSRMTCQPSVALTVDEALPAFAHVQAAKVDLKVNLTPSDMPTTEAMPCVSPQRVSICQSQCVETKLEQENPHECILQPLEVQQDDHPLPEIDAEMQDEEPKPVNRIAVREEKELFQHRIRGHSDFDPRCQHCATARGISQHRRRNTEGSHIEVMVDFCYLHVPGGGTREMLVMHERASGLVGFVAMQDNREPVKAEVKRWFELAGLSGPSPATVIVRTDAQQSLAVLMRSSVACQVQSAAPQHHELVGGAERSVPSLKEHLSTLRSDMQAQGWDIRFDPPTLWYVCRYVAFGSDKTRIDIIVGQKRRPPSVTMFGATVFAEVPDSVEAPEGARFVPAAFLGPPLYSRGILVCVVVGPVHEAQAKVFMAKSVKILNKITVDNPLCSHCLMKISQMQPAPQPVPHAPVPPNPVNPPAEPLRLGKGPPAEWLRRNGRTPGCNGCSRDYLGGRQHSAACRKRYQDWYDAQQRPAGVQPQGGLPDIAQQADDDPRRLPPGSLGDVPPVPVNVPPDPNAPVPVGPHHHRNCESM